MESAVFGPEEEPDRSNNETGSDEGKECLDAFIVDGVRGDGASCRIWSGG